VHGSARVFLAVAEAGVPALVYASSVGAYSPGPKDDRVDESWPTGGVAASPYSRQKSEVERRLDRFEAEHPGIRASASRRCTRTTSATPRGHAEEIRTGAGSRENVDEGRD
jgi:nucleoside-diphosphate-sugar epimerase